MEPFPESAVLGWVLGLGLAALVIGGMIVGLMLGCRHAVAVAHLLETDIRDAEVLGKPAHRRRPDEVVELAPGQCSSANRD